MWQRNPATVYLSKWSAASDTRRTMKQALDRVASVLEGQETDGEQFAWHALRYEDARAIAAQLADEELAPRTINKMLSAVRGTLEAAWRMGLMPDEVYRRIEIENVRGSNLPAGRALSPTEMDAIAAALPLTDERDAAILAILAGAGLRRVEVVQLVREDFGDGRIIATGKGNFKRSIPVGERWLAPIASWQTTLARGQSMFDLDVKNPRRAVSYVVEKFCDKHKLPAFTPHDLRRTFGTHVERVAGIATAQKLLGHRNISTTALYVRVDAEREAAAVKDL